MTIAKTLRHLVVLLLVAVTIASCDSATVGTGRQKAGGAPYELIAVVDKPQWESPLQDTLRSIFGSPVAYVNQYEPRLDLMRVIPSAFEGFIKVHRNVLYLKVDPSQPLSNVGQKDLYADGQLILKVTAPSTEELTAFLHQNRAEVVKAFEDAERDRAIKMNRKYKEGVVVDKIKDMFGGMSIDIPRGYTMRGTSGDSLLVTSFEYPVATQGLAVYTYPYSGKSDFELENLIAQRNNFMKNIPGPSGKSYMTTVEEYIPEVTYKRINGRFWAEMRGFWDLEGGDFMGGPMVSWSTLDTNTNQVVTIDCYVFSPKHGQRDLLRGLEALIYSVKFPKAE